METAPQNLCTELGPLLQELNPNLIRVGKKKFLSESFWDVLERQLEGPLLQALDQELRTSLALSLQPLLGRRESVPLDVLHDE